MSDDPTLWKHRYQFALEAQERSEREHRALAQQLTRGLLHSTRACEGRDPLLDQELESLRGLLRLKSLSADVLASKLDVVEERLRALEPHQAGTDPRLQAVLERLCERIAAADNSRESARALKTLRSELRNGGDAHALLERALALLPLAKPAAAAPAQAKAASETPGLLQRMFGTRNGGSPQADRAAQATSATLAEAIDEAFEPVCEAASRSLDALVDTVAAPQSEPGLRKLYENHKARFARGVRLQELVPAIEAIRMLTSAALGRARDEFGHFLVQMNQRLAHSSEALEQGHVHASERTANAEAMHATVRAGVQALREGVVAARDLEQLKREVVERVDGIGSALEQFRERESRSARESAAAAVVLAERVVELQQQTAHAEALIIEQRRLALTDPLTQMPNREAWMQRLAEEYERWRRYGRSLSLAVCDVDRFKAINDNHGHAVGDEVLHGVAACIRASLRDSDFVARFGGEEFAMLLPETTPDQAMQALETVRSAIAARPVDCGGELSLRVTASFGVSGFSDGDNAERVFARADAALYQAKGAGRDRVVVYSGSDGPAT